ncbi:hypothetical protein E4U22_008252, partial [Claviceps purpurea]
MRQDQNENTRGEIAKHNRAREHIETGVACGGRRQGSMTSHDDDDDDDDDDTGHEKGNSAPQLDFWVDEVHRERIRRVSDVVLEEVSTD